ncbi:MAG: hypothetical protein RRC34_15320 [Lentisphaeria bacterium]|nr:hypothetical protein [Lentisphaeria bacterium]
MDELSPEMQYVLVMGFNGLIVTLFGLSRYFEVKKRRRDGRVKPEDPRTFWTWDIW